MVEAFGGKNMMIRLLQANADAFKENNTKVLSITFGEILDIQKSNQDIQILVTQEILFDTKERQIKENQKLIAIQEFDSDDWYFVSINKKSKAEIKEMFPNLNNKLKL